MPVKLLRASALPAADRPSPSLWTRETSHQHDGLITHMACSQEKGLPRQLRGAMLGAPQKPLQGKIASNCSLPCCHSALRLLRGEHGLQHHTAQRQCRP